MPSFSERIGVKKPKTLLQLDSMDDDLRNSLWNVVYECYLQKYYVQTSSLHNMYPNKKPFTEWANKIWKNFFKKPIDRIPSVWIDFNQHIRTWFFDADWWCVYEFLEFLPSALDGYMADSTNKNFIKQCNFVLERELSGYRFVKNILTPITDEVELQEVITALEGSFQGAKIHLNEAINHFSNKKSPDYRNTIKEAISAVEHVCRIITGESTLDRALNKIQNHAPMNNQFKQGLEKIYHFTNGPDGIRHALIDDPNVGFDEAKFMLVNCSAFVNYIAAKYQSAEFKEPKLA